jgi:hypothetical protein
MVRWLALAALVLPALMVFAPVQAQPGRPGGIGGMPSGQPGMRGGIQGGMMGQPQGIAGGMGGGGIGGMGGGGLQDEWVCSACGAVIGHGAMKPAWSRCPSCGAKLVDGPGGFDSGSPATSPPPGPITPSPASKSNSSGSGRTVLVAVAVGVGVLVLFGVVGAIVYFNVSRNSKRNGSRRRKRVVHEE